ncbi:MAG: hypothetical protein Q7T54_02280 [Candidatus Levybacteria bacterium]|nr:hypothetical protein [Candidatus Levybacteria bacterium]
MSYILHVLLYREKKQKTLPVLVLFPAKSTKSSAMSEFGRYKFITFTKNRTHTATSLVFACPFSGRSFHKFSKRKF